MRVDYQDYDAHFRGCPGPSFHIALLSASHFSRAVSGIEARSKSPLGRPALFIASRITHLDIIADPHPPNRGVVLRNAPHGEGDASPFCHLFLLAANCWELGIS